MFFGGCESVTVYQIHSVVCIVPLHYILVQCFYLHPPPLLCPEFTLMGVLTIPFFAFYIFIRGTIISHQILICEKFTWNPFMTYFIVPDKTNTISFDFMGLLILALLHFGTSTFPGPIMRRRMCLLKTDIKMYHTQSTSRRSPQNIIINNNIMLPSERCTCLRFELKFSLCPRLEYVH
jgi:hypothetical protein